MNKIHVTMKKYFRFLMIIILGAFFTRCGRGNCSGKLIRVPKKIVVSYPNLAAEADDTLKEYHVFIIRTERNNIHQPIDTIYKILQADTHGLLMSLYFDGIKDGSLTSSNVDFPEDGWEPSNVIIVVDSTRYKDTLTNIHFHENLPIELPPEARDYFCERQKYPIAVSFFHNGKRVFSKEMSFVIQ